MDKNLLGIIDNLKEQLMKDFLIQNDGHDIKHLTRTLKNAILLQQSEGGDIYIISLSAILHDVHRLMGVRDNKFYSPPESLSVIMHYLSPLNLSSEQKEKICSVIEHHEEYSFGKECNGNYNIETYIVQDADNLDAIGAVGLVRTLEYSLANFIKIYDSSVKLYRNKYSESEPDASCIHHIYNKLLRLGENMNTNTAKEIAKPKIKLMKQFINMYIEEVDERFN